MNVTLKKAVEQKIRANARRGARFLDTISDDWFKPHNLAISKLEMTNACSCVWGQLRLTDVGQHEKFKEKMDVINGTATPGYVPAYDEDDNGSCHVDKRAEWNSMMTDEEDELYSAVAAEEWRILQDEWESLIRIRRNAARVGV